MRRDPAGRNSFWNFHFKLADQFRHKSMAVLRGYVRDAELFKDHAVEGLLSASLARV